MTFSVITQKTRSPSIDQVFSLSRYVEQLTHDFFGNNPKDPLAIHRSGLFSIALRRTVDL
jgi:hypothetical protein